MAEYIDKQAFLDHMMGTSRFLTREEAEKALEEAKRDG